MSVNFRSDCPVTSALDILGDKWILVIIKLMLLEHKQTFKAFVNSDESIATNILSTKLKLLEELGLIEQSRLPDNKKTKLYRLTQKGLSLTPLIIELALWSDKELRGMHPIILDGEPMKAMRANKIEFTERLKELYTISVLSD